MRTREHPKNNQNQKLIIRPTRKSDGKVFLSLINSLADFEKLNRPTKPACRRLLRDGFGRKKRFYAFLAFVGKKPVGYAIIFETYSSFLALPSLYLEDIFVLPEYRSQKIGLRLFKKCLKEAHHRKCGRMEWVVLDWNKKAVCFYEKLGARHLKEWLTFRLERKQFKRLLKSEN